MKLSSNTYLFLPYAHVRFDVTEYRIFYKIPLGSVSRTSTVKLGAFFLTALDQIQNLLTLFVVDLKVKFVP